MRGPNHKEDSSEPEIDRQTILRLCRVTYDLIYRLDPEEKKELLEFVNTVVEKMQYEWKSSKTDQEV